jgi:hypothetical protein
MNANIHNKKRNSMLMYEFLIRIISKSLLENDKKRQSIALSILKKCFKPGTELYKEFRLANSIYKTTVNSSSTAASILAEAKNAIRSLNIQKLKQEKSILIREADYRIIATIQTLFNEWYDLGKLDIEKLATYEDKVSEWLTTNKHIVENSDIDVEPGTTRIVSKLINQKFNEKYAKVLNIEQRAIIRAYALSEKTDDHSLKTYLSEVRDNLLQKLDSFMLNESKQDNQKLVEIRLSVLNENIDNNVDMDTVTRFLLYSQLSDELTNQRGTNEQ